MKFNFETKEELLHFLDDELLSSIEAAELLEITKVRIGQLVKEGKLDYVKEQPKIFLKSDVLKKKQELEELRKKYRPYDE